MKAADPLIVEVTRGDMVESRHRGAAVVMDAQGGVVRAWGDADRVVFPRSAIKPLQAIPLVETGAADAFSLGDEELALACASHGARPEHTDAVGRWLEGMGLSADDLECGAHEPLDPETQRALVRAGQAPGPIHNNCSGKHAGFLAAAKHLGEATRGYIGPDHPAEQRWLAALSAMAGEDLSRAPRGTDGCGIPVVGLPLAAIARAAARMADPEGLEADRAAACRRIAAAMTARPDMVAGKGRFDTVAMEATAGALAVKTGAEGMYLGVLPGLGLGVALKIDDGARRASEAAMAAILKLLGVLDGKAEAALEAYLEAPVLNAPGDRVGVVRMAEGWES